MCSHVEAFNTRNEHLKISWTSTAELEIDKISRDDLIRGHV